MKQSITRMPIEERLVGVNHRAPPIRTHKGHQSKINYTLTSSLMPAATTFMHTDSQTLTPILIRSFNYLLHAHILLSQNRKTIARNQTYHIQ